MKPSLLLLVLACSSTTNNVLPDATPDVGANADAGVDAGPTPDDLGPVLEPVRAKHSLPALAAAVWIGDTMVAQGAVGVRKLGDPTPVTTADKWHLGSDTKAMTATLAGLFADDGKLSFSATIDTLFTGEIIDAGYKPTTLDQLLMHRAGAPANPPDPIWNAMWADKRSFEPRQSAVLAMLKDPPPNPVGSYLYSNSGYMMAGAAIERVAASTWEDLMKARLFAPLGMPSCGFGAPATPGQVDQPWGHTDAQLPVAPQPSGDNPPSMGPAGTVHCSLADWGRFLNVHLKGARNEPTIAKQTTMTHLHTPPTGGDYALGWGVSTRSWAGGTTLSHSGSNTMFYVTVWIAPAKNLVMVVATNRGGNDAGSAVDEAFGPLIAAYAK